MISLETLKSLGEELGTELLTENLNKTWYFGKVPNNWKIGIIILTIKNEDTRKCRNYRGIILLNVSSKVYERY